MAEIDFVLNRWSRLLPSLLSLTSTLSPSHATLSLSLTPTLLRSQNSYPPTHENHISQSVFLPFGVLPRSSNLIFFWFVFHFQIINHKETSRSRGFGFVTFKEIMAVADQSIKSLADQIPSSLALLNDPPLSHSPAKLEKFEMTDDLREFI